MVAEKADKTKKKATETPSAEVKTEPKTEPTPADEKPSEAVNTPQSKEPQLDATQADSKPSEDVTLVLSAEEEAEIAAATNEDAVKTSTTAEAKRKKDKNVWVSNIARSTKAADLKKLFAEKFKVESAKIVTNGKSFFGYICMETPEMARDTVKEFNGATLAGKKIVLSLSRPDLKSTKTTNDVKRREVKKDPNVANGQKEDDEKKNAKSESKKDEDADNEEINKDDEKSLGGDKTKNEDMDAKLREQRRREQRTQRMIQDLKVDVKRISTELQNNRRRLTEANRRLDVEKERKAALRREIVSLEDQLKSERRRFAQDLEQMEKKRKMDEIRYQDDRATLNRELDECRKLREYLERKIGDLSRGRSPPRQRNDRSGSDKRSRMHSDSRGGRSPPPAPKINQSRDRSPPSYRSNKKSRVEEPSSRSYGNNQYQSQSSSFGGGSKSLLGHYPSGPTGNVPRPGVFPSTVYPDIHRYGGGSGFTGGYSMNNSTMLNRPVGYPDVRSSGGGPRKY